MTQDKKVLPFLTGGERVVWLDLSQGRLLPAPTRPATPALQHLRQELQTAARLLVDDEHLIRKLRRSASRVCLIVPDKTRKVPVAPTVEALRDSLREVGVGSRRIEIVVATGTHPPMNKEELKMLVGEALFSEVSVNNHDCRDQRNLVLVGYAEAELPVFINRCVCEADVKIALGSVRPHRAVGWSGGAKAILPGVAGEETIGRWHWLGWDYLKEQICSQVENPMRSIMERVAEMVGLDGLMAFVMNQDDQVAGVFAGHYIYAHRKAVEMAKAGYEYHIEEKADALIMGSGVATTMYGAAAQLQSAPDFVKHRGTVVLLADCPDGIAPGFPEILEYGYRDPETIRRLVHSGALKSLIAASHMMYVAEGLHGASLECVLVSRYVNRKQAESLGFSYAASPEEALRRVFSTHGRGCSIYAFPRGMPY